MYYSFDTLLGSSKKFGELQTNILKNNLPTGVIGLSHIHKAHYIYSISQKTDMPILVIVHDEAHATRMCEDINSMAGYRIALPFGARDYTFRNVEGVSREYEYSRLGTLAQISDGNCKIVVSSCEGMTQFTIPPAVLKQRSFVLRSGESYNLEEITKQLIDAGYIKRDQVTGAGEFSVRGGLLDIFSPNQNLPVRIEFWGDDIDSINTFDVANQRRMDWVDDIKIIPTSEVLCDDPKEFATKLRKKLSALRSSIAENIRENFARDLEIFENGSVPIAMDKYIPMIYENGNTLFDYFDGDTLLFVSEAANIKETLKNQSYTHNEDVKAMFADAILFRGLDRYYIEFPDVLSHFYRMKTVYLDTFARTVDEIRLSELINVNAATISSWGGEISTLIEDVTSFTASGYKVAVMAGTEKAVKNIESELVKNKIAIVNADSIQNLKPKQTCVLPGTLSAGMDYTDDKIAIISHVKVHQSLKKKKKKRSKDAIRNISDLSIGDYVVHVSHGVGIFEGIHKIETQGIVKDYIKIQYAGADTLYVPVTQLDLVSKYIGGREGGNLKLNKLNSGQWEKTRTRVKKAVADMAQELIKLYAERMKVKGFAFSKDTDWQTEFEEKFEYNETEDQLNSISEIKTDMESTVPMERLLCGDVGFGKTEVALRAAFKCIMDGKQVALLVPTTILAWQHYKTIIKRFEGYPINIALLSRFRTQKQQEETVRKIRRGEIDLVVGTHRIVQKDVIFKDLGLAIIDEEQRFGVKHKEQLKENNKNIDILTLSATPIPRTLNMAMSGIRDMSVLEEAPQDRQPVQTYVLEHDEGVIVEAIKRELRRDGQVYYLHNRVDTISKTAFRLSQVIPDARVGYAHGQMGEEELSDIWRKLVDHEIDILVCTTIIETGIDVSNCNTLIIEDADYMGLAQLYQIRGRIGRSNRRAFAYLTFKRGKIVSDVATKRLEAIREFTSFGSSFQIAMRDLEIRGAGNILGAQQHGHMESVGYDMYLKLLSEAIAVSKGETPKETAAECLVDIRLEAHIPDKYITSLTQRIDIYKRIAGIYSKEDALDVTDELIDRFGDPPKAVKGLIDVALLRNMASLHKITEITQNSETLLFYQEYIDMPTVSILASKLKGRVTVNAGTKPYISVRMPKGTSPLDTIRETLDILNEKQDESGDK